ncbi:MAG TPA: alpha/beta fold hydrolase [Myxococcota bacterium]|nr:alpha/beta fold hydrolase [Myxococcota bacterium]
MKVDASAFQLGDPRGGHAPAVLCLHGLTGTPYEVRPPAEALAEAGFYCEGPLLPGHGTTPRELNRTPRAAWLAASLASFDALAERHERVYVLGLSLGGLLSLAVAEARPAVRGLVVLAVPLELAWFVRGAVPWLHRVVRGLPKTPAIRDSAARLRHPGYDRMPLGAVNQLLSLAVEVRARLGAVAAPVQGIFSRLDPTVPAWNAELLLRELPPGDRELVWLERSGHVLPVDFEGSLVAEKASQFLGRLEKG